MNIDAVIISPLLCERQKASSSSTLGRHVFTYTTHVSQVFDYYLFDCFHYFSCFQWKTPSFFQYEPVIFILTHFFPLCCQPTWNPLIELCLSLCHLQRKTSDRKVFIPDQPLFSSRFTYYYYYYCYYYCISLFLLALGFPDTFHTY
jgi:hypothetical protein